MATNRNALTFAPQANKIRISSNGFINMMASAKALCKGFATHSVGILSKRTETKTQFQLSLLSII